MRVIFFIIFLIYTCSSVENKTQESERVKQETLFGRQIVKNFLIRYHLLHDRESTIALNSLVRKVAAFTSRNDLYYRAGILDTDDVFAFSIPGGYILISRGMIKTWDSIESAEFVLAHELTHISLSHSFQPENNNSFEKFLQAGLDPTGGI
ncbi:MAG TPA: M48 family metalloprotease, partial [Leptospiraceae bacterium]|nr:M48 family metalloprotease [Leptospiraceae bacterium]